MIAASTLPNIVDLIREAIPRPATILRILLNEFPIDPVKIALKVGIAVRDVQFKDIAEDSVCGGIIKENEGSGHQARLRFRLCLV